MVAFLTRTCTTQFRFGLGLAVLVLACQRGEAGATIDTAEPLVCPEGASVSRVDFPAERGGGFAERCMLPDGVSRHGASREWDGEGRRRGITNWWQGTRHGKTIFWYANGRKSNEAEHYRWQAVGHWTSWDEKGNVTDEHDFGPPDPKVGSWPMPQLGEPPPDALGSSAPVPAAASAPAAAPAQGADPATAADGSQAAQPGVTQPPPPQR